MLYQRLKLQKIIQTVSYFLKLNDKKLNYTKLIKLLYITDKEAFSRWDESVTGDVYVAMKSGPILSKTYDLVKGNGSDFEQCEWDIFFCKSNYDLLLRLDEVSESELSDSEKQLIEKIDSDYKDKTHGEMIEVTHDKNKFPEWNDPGLSSIPIPVEAILKSLNRSEGEIADIISEMKLYEKEQEFLYQTCA